MRRIFFTICLFLFINGAYGEQCRPIATAQPLITKFAEPSQPQFAMDRERGRFLVAFTTRDYSSTGRLLYNTRVQLFSDQGKELTKPQIIHSQTGTKLLYRDTKVILYNAAREQYVIAFLGLVRNPATNRYENQIKTRTVTSDGVINGPVRVVAGRPETDLITMEQLRFEASCDCLELLYSTLGIFSNTHAIHLLQLDGSAQLRSEAELIRVDDKYPQYPRMSVDPKTGNHLLIYAYTFPVFESYQYIALQVFDSTLNPIGGPVTLIRNHTYPVPLFYLDRKENEFLLVWNDFFPNQTHIWSISSSGQVVRKRKRGAALIDFYDQIQIPSRDLQVFFYNSGIVTYGPNFEKISDRNIICEEDRRLADVEHNPKRGEILALVFIGNDENRTIGIIRIPIAKLLAQ